MGVIFKRQPGGFQFAATLDVDTVEAVHQDIGNARVLEKRLEWPQTKYFVEDFASQTLPLGKTQRHGLAVYRVTDQNQHFFTGSVACSAT